LKWNNLVVTSHYRYSTKFEAFGQMHGAD